MDVRDFTPKVLDELVLRWRALSARRESAMPGRCNCGCKCATRATATQGSARTGQSASLTMAAEPAPACR
jgi:hypothetical protein